MLWKLRLKVVAVVEVLTETVEDVFVDYIEYPVVSAKIARSWPLPSKPRPHKFVIEDPQGEGQSSRLHLCLKSGLMSGDLTTTVSSFRQLVR